jgi:hypothetical protein
LKRTRRIEVIRYSRRSTRAGNEVALEPDSAAEQAAIDLLLEIPCAIEPAIEKTPDAEKQISATEVPAATNRRRPLRFLKRLIGG